MNLMTSGATQSAIVWPTQFLPGTTDHFVSNEVIAKDITAAQIWALLADASRWESYYKNCSGVTPPAADASRGPGPQLLRKDDVFTFSTFGFPLVTPRVAESVAPGGGGPTTAAGRLAWCVDDPGAGIQVYHAWLVEDLEGGRVRVLTQESQIGPPFAALREERPNKMLLGHQDWLDGLVKAARGEKIDKTNLGSVGAWERG